MFASCNQENPEEKFELYTQIINFFEDLCCVHTQEKQVGRSGVGDLRPPSSLRIQVPSGELDLTQITPQGC